MSSEPLEQFAWSEYDAGEDIRTCGACGDDFEVGDTWAYEPELASVNGREIKVVVPVHNYCAVRNGFVLGGRAPSPSEESGE